MRLNVGFNFEGDRFYYSGGFQSYAFQHRCSNEINCLQETERKSIQSKQMNELWDEDNT